GPAEERQVISNASSCLINGLDSVRPFCDLFAHLLASLRKKARIMEGRQAHVQTLMLVLVAGLLFFTRLDCPLQEPEEPRYAEIPRQMLSTGNLAVPTLHGLPYYDKPTMLYLLVMASYHAFGHYY